MSLSPADYAQARELFHRALVMESSQRPDFLEQECRGHQAIRDEVESLLRIHDDSQSRELPDYPALNVALESTRLGTFQKKWRDLIQKKSFRIALLLSLVLVLATAAKYGRDHLIAVLETEVAGHLESILNSNFQAIDLWSAHNFDEAQRWAEILSREPSLYELVRISKSAQDPVAALKSAAAQDRIHELFQQAFPPSRFTHFLIFDDSYRVISCTMDARLALGAKFAPDTELMTLANRVLSGERLLTPRRLIGSALTNAELMSRQQHFTWFGVNILDSAGHAIAGLGLAIDAREGFDKIVSIGKWGGSGETYAFNNRGLMLSESRFQPELVRAGLLKEGQSASLNIYLRDPGGNLLEGFQPAGRREDWPFTRIFAKAMDRLRHYSDQMQGQLIEPYRDYRGVDVVGAWRWHPSLHFGLITEVDAEVGLFAPRLVDMLYIAFIVLLIGLALLAAGTYFNLLRIRPAARLGSRLGQYRLLRKLTEGGSGEIYLARHVFLKRPTAIKILKPDLDDSESLRRFETEVRATSQLTHPNTVAIYDFGHTVEKCFYCAMEYLPGISLARLIEIEKRLPAHRAIHLLLQVCASLKEAHALGLIHRDIKPLNIMVCRIGGEYDVIKLLDFGLVRKLKNLIPSDAAEALSPQLRGTPGYIAPELLTHPMAATVRSDIYSLGVVAYKMLSGFNLFDAVSEASLFYDVLHTEPRHIQDLGPDLPPDLARLVMRCVDRNPMARPGSVEDLAAELEAIQLGQAWTRHDARQWWSLRDHLTLISD